MPVGTKNFPTSLDTVLELVEVTNDASTALNGALTIGATTVTVDSTSLFPSSGIITIDSENISYTGKTATTFTGCTRAAESTTAAAHDDNATVELLITAALPNVHAQSIIAIETKLGIDSSTPTANKVLRATGTGTSAWGAIVNADIDASAAIAVSKLAALTASRLPVLDASGFLSASSVTATEAGYLSGVTSAIQTQLDGKQTAFGSQTANFVYAGPASGGAASPSFRALVSGDIPAHNQAWSTITSTPTTLSGYGITDAQGLDSDLTAIATLSPSNDDIIQRKAGAWTNRTMTQLTADLNAVVGDSGSGGTKGLVPAPAAGDAAANKYLKADGTWTAVSSVSAANPTASVGLAAVNGVAATFMRSDAAPSLDVTIAPTWTGRHTFASTSTTGTGATAGSVFTYNSLTTGDGLSVSSSSATSGNLVKIASTSTAAASSALTGLNIAMSGANGTTAQTVTGASISVTNTNATSGTNVALTASASGAATANYAIVASNGALALGGTSSSAVSAKLTTDTFSFPVWTLQKGDGTAGGINFFTTFASFGGNDTASATMFYNGVSHFLSLGSVTQLRWSSAGSSIGSLNGTDTILRRAAAANIALGTTDAASPVAQTLSVQNVVAGTTNTAGATWTLRGSLGTSQGVPGRIHLTGGAMIAASGTTAQTAVDRAILNATKVLTNNSATTITNVTAAASGSAGGQLGYYVEITDGTDYQYEVGIVSFGVTNKGGAFSGNTATKFGNHQNATSGTLTVTFAISGANPAVLSVNANSSLTPSTGYPRIVYWMMNGGNQAVSIQ